MIHHRELKRTTNSGKLATEALTNSEVRVRGVPGETLDLTDLQSGPYQNLLFFPSDDAHELTADYVRARRELDPRPFQLIVPDGNWRQASKVSRRHSELKDVPRVKISAINTAKSHLRTEHMPEGMSTLEAIARAFHYLEGDSVGQALQDIYRLKLQQTLIGRGENQT